MDKEITTPRRGRIWIWWAVGAVCAMILLGAGRLYYPSFRQQQLITQLTARGFTFKPLQIAGDWRRAWVNYAWLPKSWQTAFRTELMVQNPSGVCSIADMALVDELLSLDTEGLHAPPRCRVTLNLDNATDRDLTRLPSKLTGLKLGGSEITDASLVALRTLSQLDYLRLDARQVSDRGLEHLAGLANLTSLRISSEHISDAGLIHLQGLTKIDFLRLMNTRISDAGLAHLSGLTGLRHLDVSGAQIRGPGLTHLSKPGGLQTLNLTGNPIDDAGLVGVEPITSLNWLSLHKTKVTVDCYQSLVKLPNLNRVEFRDTRVTAATLAEHPGIPPGVLKMMQHGLQSPLPAAFGGNRDTWLLTRPSSAAPASTVLPK